MLIFKSVQDELPVNYRPDCVFIVSCPEWNDEGYQVCSFRNGQFCFDGQPNDMFMDTVEGWAIVAMVRS